MIMTNEKECLIAIALGDAGGIGPEVALKAVAAELAANDSRYLLIGDESLVRSLNEQLGLKLDIRSAAEAKPTDRITVSNPMSGDASHSTLRVPHSPEAARAAIAWLKHGAQLCLRGEAARAASGECGTRSVECEASPDIGLKIVIRSVGFASTADRMSNFKPSCSFSERTSDSSPMSR